MPSPAAIAAPRVPATVRRSAGTWLLLGLVAVLTAAPAAVAVRSVLVASGTVAVDLAGMDRQQLAASGVTSVRGLQVTEAFSAAAFGAVALVCLILLVGLLRWRDWARESAMGVFGLGGLVLVVFSAVGLTAGAAAPRASEGVLAGLVVLGVAVLCIAPPVRSDFERQQVRRAVLARAAYAARRASGRSGLRA